jgi:hypothetical protein
MDEETSYRRHSWTQFACLRQRLGLRILLVGLTKHGFIRTAKSQQVADWCPVFWQHGRRAKEAGVSIEQVFPVQLSIVLCTIAGVVQDSKLRVVVEPNALPVIREAASSHAHAPMLAVRSWQHPESGTVTLSLAADARQGGQLGVERVVVVHGTPRDDRDDVRSPIASWS